MASLFNAYSVWQFVHNQNLFSGYTGANCEKKVINKRSTLLTSTTHKVPTIPTTTVALTTAGSTCIAPQFNCSGHYNCGLNMQKECIAGYTGSNCNTIIPQGVADCDVFECKENTSLLSAGFSGTALGVNDI